MTWCWNCRKYPWRYRAETHTVLFSKWLNLIHGSRINKEKLTYLKVGSAWLKHCLGCCHHVPRRYLIPVQCAPIIMSLRWRHNERDGVSNQQPHDCLLNRLVRRIWKKTSKLRVTGFREGNSPLTGEFPAQVASNAENVSFWWRHHVYFVLCCVCCV